MIPGTIIAVGAIGLSTLMLLSKLPDMIPQYVFMLKPSPWGQAIGEGLNTYSAGNIVGTGSRLFEAGSTLADANDRFLHGNTLFGLNRNGGQTEAQERQSRQNINDQVQSVNNPIPKKLQD